MRFRVTFPRWAKMLALLSVCLFLFVGCSNNHVYVREYDVARSSSLAQNLAVMPALYLGDATDVQEVVIDSVRLKAPAPRGMRWVVLMNNDFYNKMNYPSDPPTQSDMEEGAPLVRYLVQKRYVGKEWSVIVTPDSDTCNIHCEWTNMKGAKSLGRLFIALEDAHAHHVTFRLYPGAVRQ